MLASLLTEFIVRPLFEIVFYGLGYVIGVVVVPIFSFGHYTVEPWDFQKRAKTQRRAGPLQPRVVSSDAAAGVVTLFIAGLAGYFLWRAAGA